MIIKQILFYEHFFAALTVKTNVTKLMFVYFSVCYLIVLISFGTNSRWYFNKCKRIERVIIGLILLNLIQNYNCQTTNTTNVNVSVMTSHVRPRRSDDMWKDQVTVSSNWPSDFITQPPFVSIHNTSIHNTSQRSKDISILRAVFRTLNWSLPVKSCSL